MTLGLGLLQVVDPPGLGLQGHDLQAQLPGFALQVLDGPLAVLLFVMSFARVWEQPGWRTNLTGLGKSDRLGSKRGLAETWATGVRSRC